MDISKRFGGVFPIERTLKPNFKRSILTICNTVMQIAPAKNEQSP